MDNILSTLIIEIGVMIVIATAIIYTLLHIIMLMLRAAWFRTIDKTAKWVGGIHNNLTKRGNYAKNRS